MVEDAGKSTEEQCYDNQVRERLKRHCEQLSPPYREIAIRYFYEEYNTADIASQLERNEKTVQTQVYRAKAMLKNLYGKEQAV